MELCCWRTLLRETPRRDARLFACVRAWRWVALRRKHRFCVATAREWRQVHFFEVRSSALDTNSQAVRSPLTCLTSKSWCCTQR